MAKIVAGMASSHAFTFINPELWDQRRQMTRNRYKQRYGVEPPEQPQVLEETLEANQVRYKRIRDGLNALRQRIHALHADVLIMIGDDQDENYTEDNLPQFAIYLGKEMVAADRNGNRGARYRCDAELSRAILSHCVDAGVDVAYSARFPKDELISHAHREPLDFLGIADRMPVIPVFINAVHVPAPTPSRCYQFGQILRQAIQSVNDRKRVVLYASGGLSHFTAGFPWSFYKGPHTVGSICQDFDRKIIETIFQGQGEKLTQLSAMDLLDNGNIELRQWIALMGAIGKHKPEQLVYEPFYRGLLGMAVGYWDLEMVADGET
jgi:hypothetical protein